MTAPGAASPHYTYPALGVFEGGSEPEPLPRPPAFPPGPSRPEPHQEAWAAADAVVRAALSRKLSFGARALLQPGAIPLRPLTLTEIYNGAVALIRANPKVVLGFSFIVLAVGALLQAAVLTPALRLALQATGVLGSAAAPDSPDGRSTISMAGILADAPISALTAMLLTGCVMPVLAKTLVGERSVARAAWQETKGRALPLAGLAFVVLGIQGAIVLLPVLVALALFAAGFPAPGALLVAILAEPFCLPLAYAVGVFLALAAPAMMSERLGVIAACRRSVRLARRGFWKLLGVGLLTRLVTAVVGLSLSLPFTLIGSVLGAGPTPDGHKAVISLVLLTLGQLLAQSVLAPFAAGVTALLYVDQRMRQEAYDLVLLGQINSSDAADRQEA